MEITNEDIVTRILSSNEIIQAGKNSRNKNCDAHTNPIYDLGEFLRNYKPEPSPYEDKYVFIR